MIKSIFFSLSLLLFSNLTYAEYLGIDEVPVGDQDIQKVLNNAVTTKDFNLIKEWKDSFKTDYSENKFCGFTNSFYSESPISSTLLDAQPNSFNYANFLNQPYYSIVPASCDNIYIWKLAKLINRTEYSPDIFDLVKSPEKQRNLKAYDDYAQQREIIKDILIKTPNEQYQLLLPIAINRNIDFEIRKLAMDKFLAGYKNADQTDLQSFKDLKAKMENTHKNNENKNFKLTFDDSAYLSVVDPKTLMLVELNFQLFDRLHAYSKRYDNARKPLPIFDKHVIKRGGYTDEEIKNLNLSQLSDTDLNAFNNVNQTLRLFITAFNAYKEDHDLNYQTDNGNTFFMDIFSNRTLYSISRNTFAPSLVRFFLEEGANPLLENKDKKTAYSLYIDNFGEDSDTKNVKDAFVKKEYEFIK